MRDYVKGNLSCSGWHGAGSYNWLSYTSYGFMRGTSGIFSFYGGGFVWTTSDGCGRGVAVVGTGL